MKCIHHNDQDGRCAAYWVGQYFSGVEPVEFIEMNYGWDFPIGTIQKDEIVWIVDFSLDLKLMSDLLKITTNVVWLDHHESAIERYKDFPEKIDGIRFIGRSGAYLTWLYTTRKDFREVCSGDTTREEITTLVEEAWDSCPYPTQLVDDYDVFIMNMINTMPFYYGSQALDTDPSGEFWSSVHSDPNYLDRVINGGTTIKTFTFRTNTEWCNSYGYESEFGGVECFVLNTPAMGSMSFGSKLHTYPFVARVTWDGIKWSVTMYSNKETGVDVSKIAMAYNGGGHVHAAGFTCDDLPFKRVEK